MNYKYKNKQIQMYFNINHFFFTRSLGIYGKLILLKIVICLL